MVSEIDNLKLSTPSLLYSLVPISIGTGLVECGTSYLSRLAFNHRVINHTLISKIILPLIRKKYHINETHELMTSWWALNSNGHFANRWINIIEETTNRYDIHYLTMLPWRQVFRDKDLVKKRRVWCPICFSEWEKTNQVLYEPLIWYINLIDFCPIHETLLMDTCPNCQRQNPVLGRHSQIGYCSYCGAWLGKNQNIIDHPKISAEMKYRVNFISGLLTNNNCSSLSLKRIDNEKYSLISFHEAINREIHSTSQLATLFSIHPTTIYKWRHGGSVSLPVLLTGMYKINTAGSNPLHENNSGTETKLEQELLISIYCDNLKAFTELIQQKIHNAYSLNDVYRQLGISLTAMRKKHPELLDKIRQLYKKHMDQKQEEIKLKLCEYLYSQDQPKSLIDISNEMGVSQKRLRRIAPDLYQGIKEKFINFESERKRKKIQEWINEIEHIGLSLIEQNIKPTSAKVIRHMEKPGILRNPEVSAALYRILLLFHDRQLS